jgi:cytochrome b
MNRQNLIKVWDPVVRLFHWTLVPAFFLAYFTEEDLLTLHVWAGYVVFGLIVFRLAWGFAGTNTARFSNFVFKPRVVLNYLKDTLMLKAPRYVGHNPAGGAMIILLLISLLVTSLTGVAVYGTEESAGPLAGWLAGAGEYRSEQLEELHEFFANFTLLLVIIHVAGVVTESVIHRENLVRAMFTGYKRRAQL